MFWDTVVMADALKSAETHLGPVGRYDEGAEESFCGSRLYTKQAGFFWYGDIAWPGDRNALKAIAAELKESLYIIPEPDPLDARPFEKRALEIVTV